MRRWASFILLGLSACPSPGDGTSASRATSSASASGAKSSASAVTTVAPPLPLAAVGDKKGGVSIDGVATRGADLSNATRVVARMRGRFVGCFKAGLEANPELAGTIVLLATLAKTGSVTKVAGYGSTLGPIVGCLKAVVMGGAFDAPGEGVTATVTIPLTIGAT